jgi:hypothetical protein
MSLLTIRDFPKYPEYADAIMALQPNARFGISGNNYATLDWQSDHEMPTEDAVKVKLNELLTEYNVVLYREQRFKEYPHLELQLEMLWDDMNAGNISGKETSTWFAAIQEVKDNFPKP